jgi:two-component system, chemotaxis family, chemotaxis protein CheY
MLNQQERRVVLVVDDSATMGAILRKTLTEQEFVVLEATDGLHALAVLSTDQRIDLVLTDLNMPAVDGISLVRKIRKDAVRSLVPVIIQTSEAQGSFIAIGKEAGATGWLTKPVSEQKLLLAIRRLLPRHSAAPPPAT